MAKLSTYMVGVVIVAMIVGVFGVFLTQMRAGYGEQEGMDSSDLALLNKMDNITAETAIIQNNINTFSEADNPFDVIGNFFSSGWASLKLAGNSLNLVSGKDGIIDTIADKTDMGDSGKILVAGISTILVIIIVIGVLLSALIKREL